MGWFIAGFITALVIDQFGEYLSRKRYRKTKERILKKYEIDN